MLAAIALQKSTSSPLQLPALSACEKPASPVFTPQTSWPRDLIASMVLPANAGALAKVRAVANAASAVWMGSLNIAVSGVCARY